jgi:succinate dehydrogenase / fumarate reductase cytochrome b subunit
MLIFAGDGGDKFNAYGYFLNRSPLILVIESYLFIAAAFHVIAAFWIALSEGKINAYMTTAPWKANAWARIRLGVTGIIILAFFVVHLLDFRFGIEYEAPPLKFLKQNPWFPYFGGEQSVGFVRDLYRLQVETFSDPKHCAFYLVSMCALSSHLKHGWRRVNLKIVPKEHQKNAQKVVPLLLDTLCAAFASTVVWTYFKLVK